jgi:amidase
MSSTWESLASDKRSRIASSIPPEWRIPATSLPQTDSVIDFPKTSTLLSAKELEITASSAVDLVAQLAKGALTSVEVTIAFCKRAALAQQVTNCVHEFFPEMAIARARELDGYLEKKGKTVGALHGLPVCLKDQVRVEVCRILTIFFWRSSCAASFGGSGNLV